MKVFTRVLATGWLLAFPMLLRAQTSSPFPPPEEDVGKYVINSGAGLDTGCTFRSGSPLIVRLTVPATFNEKLLNPDGTLKDAAKLIQSKLIGARAKISLPIFDIDDKAITDGTFAPEVDRMSFNDDFIKTLSGFDNTWVNDSFDVDITKVKFASPSNPSVQNELRIDIDTANVGNGEFWCTAVDWVAIDFDAAYPFVLAHGIAANRDTWLEKDAPGVLTTMEDSGVLYERFSTANKNGSVADNAADLKPKIKGFLDKVKAKKVNLIVHSKGGLDSQALAMISAPEFEVLSLGTLSTPHRGSVVADLTLLQRLVADVTINNGQDPNGYAKQFINSTLAGIASGFGAGPQPPGLDDLTTYAAIDAINAGVRGNVPNTFTIGADAGPSCTSAPTNAQIDPMNPVSNILFIGSYTYDALRLAYQSICEYSSAKQVKLEFMPTFNPDYPVITVLTYQTVLNATANPNDVVVGLTSANPGYGTPLGNQSSINHATVKNSGNVRKILDRTISLR